jgi:hypothetical protein
LSDVFGGLPVIYYDWNKGMDSNKEGITIWLGGEYVLLKNVQFYDNIRGFIQTESAFFMPDHLMKNESNLNNEKEPIPNAD